MPPQPSITYFPNQWSYSLIRTACLNGTSDKLKAVPSTSTEGNHVVANHNGSLGMCSG